jgi:6-pyruvoyltetrahydropterin/6-carboxytetrahydropterin synthase
MFILSVKDTFAAAHRLESYHGECERLHGHNFQVEALVSGNTLSNEGVILDFKVLKAYLKEILDKLDHTYLNEIPFFQERASSSEYIAMFIFNSLKERIQEGGVSVVEVRVWESDKVYAAYRGG